MKEAHLEPVRAAWNGAEHSRPWRAESGRIYDANGKLIGAMTELLDAELVEKAVNIMPLVFVDHERDEDAALWQLKNVAEARMLAAERSVVADAKALVAQNGNLHRHVDALLATNEHLREVLGTQRDRLVRWRPVIELAKRWCNRPVSCLQAGQPVLANDAEMFGKLHDAVGLAIAGADT